MILSQRPNDDEHKNGFTRWPFMSTHTGAWASSGTWTRRVENVLGEKYAEIPGFPAMSTGAYAGFRLRF